MGRVCFLNQAAILRLHLHDQVNVLFAWSCYVPGRLEMGSGCKIGSPGLEHREIEIATL